MLDLKTLSPFWFLILLFIFPSFVFQSSWLWNYQNLVTFFQNWVAAYINWGDKSPLLHIYTDTNVHVLEKELYFGSVPSTPLQCCSVRNFLYSFAPYKLTTLAENNFEYQNPICVFTWRTKKKWLGKIFHGHLNFFSDKVSSGQGCLEEQLWKKMTGKLCISSSILESQMALPTLFFYLCTARHYIGKNRISLYLRASS